jgi:hypothetical protein
MSDYPVILDNGEPCHDIAATVFCQVCAPSRDFDKPTTGQSRTAGREAPVGASQGGDRPRADPINGPGSETAGRDRRCLAPDPPHVGERWRHLRSGITATVVYRLGGEGVYVDRSAEFWPIDVFMARWERA